MKKFLVLYTAEMSAENHFGDLSPEDIEKMNKAWMDWAEKAGEHLLDFGNPTVAVAGTAPGVGGYSFLQAENVEDLADLVAIHPHKLMGGNLDLYEVVTPPGM
ncbi:MULTISPECIES: hypothetical protein [unclassified Lactococcus]|uniref:hypothetical protein n=1 Tax=unclassified Lactococcus TaxID=2643510 RepID=UPI0011CCBE64|nr:MULTISPECIES: hypothetical protein [unclassified Lactococcus]MQW23685.1 hypothetical protein [Lactococcus sp. dk101]TXK37517.1 hypothetical protein FVP42_08425 [Lactococcus sp. dk310]TXK48965.1 hypothetical protein FVP43_08555 [Lactococcus sp. dk322]